jgi:hypothetical protein
MSGDSVLEAILGCIDAWTEDIDEAGMSEELGFDVSLPLERLREDLAIAARVRSCTVNTSPVSWDAVSPDESSSFAWTGAVPLLAYLLQGDPQP